MSPAIEIENLTFGYKDKPVLSGISLSVEIGEMVAVLGPNGSGKTTLIKLVSGALSGEGTIKLHRKPLGAYSRRELSRLFAVVPQESAMSFAYTVAEIVLMGRASHHHPLLLESKRDREVALRSMEVTGVESLADRYLHELSGGEKQRVFIARALAQEPQILLLDEPAAFLDLKHQLGVLDLLKRLNRERGLTIMAALHDLNLAALYFARLVMLRDGQLFCDGPAREILTERTIYQVYGVRVRVQADRSGKTPQVLLDPEAAAEPTQQTP